MGCCTSSADARVNRLTASVALGRVEGLLRVGAGGPVAVVSGVRVHEAGGAAVFRDAVSAPPGGVPLELQPIGKSPERPPHADEKHTLRDAVVA